MAPYNGYLNPPRRRIGRQIDQDGNPPPPDDIHTPGSGAMSKAHDWSAFDSHFGNEAKGIAPGNIASNAPTQISPPPAAAPVAASVDPSLDAFNSGLRQKFGMPAPAMPNPASTPAPLAGPIAPQRPALPSISNPPPVTNYTVPRGTRAEQGSGASADPFMPTNRAPLNIPSSTVPQGATRGQESSAIAANRTLYSPGTAQRTAPPQAIDVSRIPYEPAVTTPQALAIGKKFGAGPTGGSVVFDSTRRTPGYTGTVPPPAPAPAPAPVVAPQPAPVVQTPSAQPVVTAGATGPKGASGVPAAAVPGAAFIPPTTANDVGQMIHNTPAAVGEVAADLGQGVVQGANAVANAAKAAKGVVDRVGGDFVAGVQGKTPQEWQAETAENARQHAVFESRRKPIPASPLNIPPILTGPMTADNITGRPKPTGPNGLPSNPSGVEMGAFDPRSRRTAPAEPIPAPSPISEGGSVVDHRTRGKIDNFAKEGGDVLRQRGTDYSNEEKGDFGTPLQFGPPTPKPAFGSPFHYSDPEDVFLSKERVKRGQAAA